MKLLAHALLALTVCCKAAHAGDVKRSSLLEELSGWRVVLDETHLAAWDVRGGEVRLDGAWVVPATNDVRLWLREPLDDFELRARVSTELCELVSVRVRAGEVELRSISEAASKVGGVLRARVPESGALELGPIVVERAPSGSKPWRVGLRAVPPAADAFRDVTVREWDMPIGVPIALPKGVATPGWRALGDAHARVEDDVLVIEGAPASAIVAERAFGDFRFECDVAWTGEPAWSLELLAPPVANDRRAGRSSSASRCATWRPADEVAFARARERDGWKRLRVECVGPWLRAWLDGAPWLDEFDAREPARVLGFGFDARSRGVLRVRNTVLHELGTPVWEPLALERLPHAADVGRTELVSRDAWTEGTFRVVVPATIDDLVIVEYGTRDPWHAVGAGRTPPRGAHVGASWRSGSSTWELDFSSRAGGERVYTFAMYEAGSASTLDDVRLRYGGESCAQVDEQGRLPAFNVHVLSADDEALKAVKVFVLAGRSR